MPHTVCPLFNSLAGCSWRMQKLPDLPVPFHLLRLNNLQTSYKHQGTWPDEYHFSSLLFCENAASATLQSSNTGHKMLHLVCETVRPGKPFLLNNGLYLLKSLTWARQYFGWSWLACQKALVTAYISTPHQPLTQSLCSHSITVWSSWAIFQCSCSHQC